MKIYFDCEFMEDGRVVDPLAWAGISDNGHLLYLVITDTDRERANEFVVEHVLPYLDDDYAVYGVASALGVEERCVEIHRCTRAEAGAILKEWVTRIRPAGEPLEFWADFNSYDWVMTCQFFGPMGYLPEHWPMFAHEVQQRARVRGYMRSSDLPSTPQGMNAHHAMVDAYTVKLRLDMLG